MQVIASLLALFFAQWLPGLLVVKLAGLGRAREERWVMAGVLASPIAACVYLASLLAEWPLLYWILLAGVDLAAVLVPAPAKPAAAWPRKSRLVLLVLVAALAAAYLVTTGSYYRVDAEGALVVDRALQRDVLFHLGVVRSLEASYPASLLSVSGMPIGYHVGYHLQIAAWARFFGVDAMNGLLRLAPLYFLGLLVTSAFVLARRILPGERAARLAPVLVLCSGWGFLFFSRPSLGFWSLAFMDVTLVSIFLTNPLLPALPVLFVGLCLLDDYLRSGERGALLVGSFAFGFLLVVKMFVGAQVLAGLGISALLGFRSARLRNAFLLAVLVASVPLAHTLLAAEGSNTSVGARPLEIVRYSMEKLDFDAAAASLASVGRFEAPQGDGSWTTPVLVTLLWAVGFLGSRIFGLRNWARDLRPSESARSTMAWFVAVGFPAALIFRIAPAEATGLSRLEAQNDVVWFAAQSGVLLWFWTAERLSRLGPLAASAIVILLTLPATVQHFVQASSLEPDRIGAARIEAARRAKELSKPASVWVDPIDRARPSLLPYLSGRPVVYDPYVGYDYMFVGRDAIEYRHHAVAQFWASEDPGYRSWFLDHFGVELVWQESGRRALAETELLFDNGEVALFRAPPDARAVPMETPVAIGMGGRGTPFLGRGWARSSTPRVRRLEPGSSPLYVPRESHRSLRITLEHEGSRESGALVVEGLRQEVSRRAGAAVFDLPPREARGLDAVDVEWRGLRPLTVTGIRLETGPR